MVVKSQVLKFDILGSNPGSLTPAWMLHLTEQVHQPSEPRHIQAQSRHQRIVIRNKSWLWWWVMNLRLVNSVIFMERVKSTEEEMTWGLFPQTSLKFKGCLKAGEILPCEHLTQVQYPASYGVHQSQQ